MTRARLPGVNGVSRRTLRARVLNWRRPCVVCGKLADKVVEYRGAKRATGTDYWAACENPTHQTRAAILAEYDRLRLGSPPDSLQLPVRRTWERGTRRP